MSDKLDTLLAELREVLAEYRPLSENRHRRLRALIRLERESDRAWIDGGEAVLSDDLSRELRAIATFASIQPKVDDETRRVHDDEQRYRALEDKLADLYNTIGHARRRGVGIPPA